MSLSIDASRCTGEIREIHKETTMLAVQRPQKHEVMRHAAETTKQTPHNPLIMQGGKNELPPGTSNHEPNDSEQGLEHRREWTCGHRTHVARSRKNMWIQCLTMRFQ